MNLYLYLQKIINNPKTFKRILKSYKIILNFYDIKLNQKTKKITKTKN